MNLATLILQMATEGIIIERIQKSEYMSNCIEVKMRKGDFHVKHAIPIDNFTFNSPGILWEACLMEHLIEMRNLLLDGLGERIHDKVI